MRWWWLCGGSRVDIRRAGGIEAAESPEAALRRKFLEDVGGAATVGALIGEAEQFVVTRDEGVVLKQERFYRVELPGVDVGWTVDGNSGAEHSIGWIVADGEAELLDGAQRWAVTVARGTTQGSDE